MRINFKEYLPIIADNIKRIRQERKYTQKEVAERMGINCRLLQKWETGETNISLAHAIELSKTLNVDINEFFKK